jgi:hypothetical protein
VTVRVGTARSDPAGATALSFSPPVLLSVSPWTLTFDDNSVVTIDGENLGPDEASAPQGKARSRSRGAQTMITVEFVADSSAPVVQNGR